MVNGLPYFTRHLFNPRYATTAIRVALVVGTLLFAINHGAALLHGEMNLTRWIAGILTYCVPYVVNIHGQVVSRSR